MKVKVEDLTNEQLNEWVARARGWQALWIDRKIDGIYSPKLRVAIKGDAIEGIGANDYTPTTNPAQWAELIERFKVSLKALYPAWQASIGLEPRKHLGGTVFGGLTPAIAICRAVIASTYGDFVEVDGEE